MDNFLTRLKALSFIPVFLILLNPVVFPTAEAAETERIRGDIRGALFEIALPADWNGSVWIEAHGLRPEQTPLSAVVPVRSPFVRGLLEDGWLVATTSYRRNGYTVLEAADDVAALAEHVREAYQPSGFVVVEGQSMGGAVVARLAEEFPGAFHGAIIIGGALEARSPSEPEFAWRHVPLRPLLFLTNSSESESPERYVAAVRANSASEAIQPVSWSVQRTGHVNVNARERRKALDALVVWLQTGRVPPDGDATVAPEPGPGVAVPVEGGLQVEVIDLSRVYGNLVLEVQPAELESIGVRPGDSFRLEGPGGTAEVFFGTSYADVPQGAWVAFVTADGHLMVARNFAAAAPALGVDDEGVRLGLFPGKR